MHIPSYQINNVLNVYRRQLSQGKPLQSRPKAVDRQPVDTIDISNKGKRKSVVEKVANDIVNKISQYEPGPSFEKTLADQLEKHENKPTATQGQTQKRFEYNILDQNNRKVVNSLSIEDSSVLIGRLEQLAQQAVNGEDEE